MSRQAAIAAECANEHNAFWSYHDLLIEFQDAFSRDKMVDLARSIGLDKDPFSACLKNRGPAPDFTLPSPPFAEGNKVAWSHDRDEQEKV